MKKKQVVLTKVVVTKEADALDLGLCFLDGTVRDMISEFQRSGYLAEGSETSLEKMCAEVVKRARRWRSTVLRVDEVTW